MGTLKRPRKAGPADIVLPTAALGAALTAWQDVSDRGLASVALQAQAGAVAAIQESIGRGPLSAIQESLIHHGALSASLASIWDRQPPITAQWYQESFGAGLTAILESFRPAFEVLRGIDWRRLQCRWALRAVYAGDLEELRWFAHEVLRKPARYAHAVAGTDLEDDWPWAVAEALRQTRWVTADDPVAYLQAAAERIAWQRYAADHLRGPGGELVSLDRRVTLAGDPLAALIPDGRDDFAEVETSLDVWLICRQAELTGDELQLIEARCRGVTRQAAPAVLGWPARKVEAVWRSAGRKLARQRAA